MVCGSNGVYWRLPGILGVSFPRFFSHKWEPGAIRRFTGEYSAGGRAGASFPHAHCTSPSRDPLSLVYFLLCMYAFFFYSFQALWLRQCPRSCVLPPDWCIVYYQIHMFTIFPNAERPASRGRVTLWSNFKLQTSNSSTRRPKGGEARDARRAARASIIHSPSALRASDSFRCPKGRCRVCILVKLQTRHPPFGRLARFNASPEGREARDARRAARASVTNSPSALRASGSF